MLKYLLVSSFMFLCGITGLFLTKKHMILWLLSIELIFLAMNYNFIIFSVFLDDLIGQFYVLNILAMCAAEAAMGLAILVMFFSLRGGMSLDLMNVLKG